MKRYEAYKPTSVEWYPAIPQGWEWRYLFQIAHEQTIKKPVDEMYPVMTLSYGEIKRKKNTEAGLVPSNYDSYQMLYKGNIVLRLIDLQNDHTSLRTGLVKETGIITSAYTCIMPTENPAYIQYLLHSYDTKKVFYGYGGGVRQSIGFKDIRHLRVPVPPRAEQDQIVRYLDWQVSKINRLIAAKRKEIDAIHDMEHLYIDHVFSEIANQKTIRLKYLVEQFVDCPHETPEYCKDGDYCVIRTADQDYGYLRSETLMYRLTESEYTNRIRRAPLNAGDIVYGREGERWGLACVIPESEKFCLGQRIMQFVCNKQMVTPEYVMWALNSSYVRNQGILDTMGSTSPHVNISTIINFRIPYTSREHQHTLVSKIECTMQKYRQLCERIENEIQLLHDLRTRLISDVVTGQIDVRGIQVPDDEYINNEITEEEFEEESENNEEE